MKNLPSTTAAKIAETFSDEAAEIAAQQARQRLQQLGSQLNSGLPIDPVLLKNLTIVAGNRIAKGAVTFKEFVEEMAQKLGNNVKSYLNDLETVYRDVMREFGFAEKVSEAEIKQTRLELKKAEQAVQRERNLLDSLIREAESHPNYNRLTAAEKNWLNSDQRHKDLAIDPAKKIFNIEEAKAALEAERSGVLKPPVRRAMNDAGKEIGGDYFDGSGKLWDVKLANAGAKKIADVANTGENILVDARGLSAADLASLKTQINALLKPGAGEVRFVN